MRRFHVPGAEPGSQAGLTRFEKRRIFLLALAVLLVAGLLGTSVWKARSYEAEPDARLPEASPPRETVALPDIDAEAIAELVEDGTEVDRVVLEGSALELLLQSVRLLTPRHFEAMGARELDREAVEELRADADGPDGPDAHRAAPFFARGWIEEMRSRRRSPTQPEEWLGRLILEDESAVYFLVLELPERAIVGDFVRVDGLFLKVFSDERLDPHAADRGEWIEGPLIVGPRAVRSYPAIAEPGSLRPGALATVEDDLLFRPGGGGAGEWSGLPFEPLWRLMAYAASLPEGEVDWDAAPELDAAAMKELTADGARFRGQPFRIPISRLQDVRVIRADENPARIESYTTGWIGNVTWKNVLYFQAPFARRDLRLRDLAFGKGFFLKNFAYESLEQGVRTAPVFVLAELERHEVVIDPIFRRIAYGVAAMTVVLAITFFFLLRRDRQRSRNLHEEIVRRRRERRLRAAKPAPDPSGSS